MQMTEDQFLCQLMYENKMCESMKSSSNVLDPGLGFMQYLEHLQFLEYLLRV